MSKKVFIVDDSITARQSIRLKLEGHGYEIFEAVDGLMAQEKLRHQEIDLLITDYAMPNMNGIELARAVRSMVGKSFLPILILSSNREENLKAEARALGVASWLDKTTDLGRLPALVKLTIGS